MANIIRFIGSSGSGKTTIVAAVVRQLAAREVSTAVIKHAHHDVDLDVAGKDSHTFNEAGARCALVASSSMVARFECTDAAPALEDLAARVPAGIDVVLAEGFHEASTPYFLVTGPCPDEDPRPVRGELLGRIRSSPCATARSDQAAMIATTIHRWLDQHAEELRLDELLREAHAFHGHLCPGQVLGVRLAKLGAEAVGLPEPRGSKALIVWVENDRCGADAVQTVTGCRPGKRTLKLVDHGKLAATFLNTRTGEAMRVVARADSRERAAALFPDLPRKEAQTAAYRTLPVTELFDVQRVSIELDEFDAPGKPLIRVTCVACMEEVNDFRHVTGDDGPLCRACAGDQYYKVPQPVQEARSW